MIFRTILLGLFAGLLTACGNISYGVSDGVPLIDLDLGGAPPTEIDQAGRSSVGPISTAGSAVARRRGARAP